MTSAYQTGQFHTGSSDRPAAEPSLFVAMADPPYLGVEAEEAVTQAFSDAAHQEFVPDDTGEVPESESEPDPEPEVEPETFVPEAEEQSLTTDLTVAELKDLLDDAGIDYPSNAHKADLVALAEENGLLEVVEEES